MIAVSGISLRPRYLRLSLLLPFAIACGGGAVPASSAANSELHGDGPSSPTTLAARPAPRLVAGDHATCLRGDGGKVTCWGPLPHSLDDLLPHPEKVPVEARLLAGAPPAAAVAIGYGTCVIDSAGAASCLDPKTLQFAPMAVSRTAGAQTALRMIAEDGSATARGCVVFQDGVLACRPSPEAPFQPIAGLPPVVRVITPVTHTCALTDDGRVWCFGDNEAGGLGDATTTNRDAPVPVVDLDHVVQISGRRLHTCALRSDGHVFCWGLGDSGQLGDGIDRPTDGTSSRPVRVRDLDDVTAISAGNAHTCALRSDGHVYCWGGRTAGPTTGPVPVKIPDLDNVVEIAAGGGHQCALRRDGSVWCWGVTWWIPVKANTLRPHVERPVRIAGVGP